MRKVKVAATQMSCSWNKEENLAKAEAMVREAAKQGANVVLLQELFEMPYFCQQEKYEYYNLATSFEENPAIKHFQPIAKELDMVIPISFYEEAGNTTFNTVAMIDADGSLLGTYRKTHIPCGESYEEKFYFSPGDTGFKVWKTKYGKIGVGICWDQWFPESARCMALLGAEMLLYPTAIGSEPVMDVDSMEHWRRCMQGHAAANIMPVIASNRIGTEEDVTSMTFYGSSFIADETGALVASADRQSETVLVAEFDLDAIRDLRIGWGVFRDRRPDMYGPMFKLDAR
ncbi:MAG TPA: N-carbamoylputrescine amidase [Lachnospiraceae bacterium]|nr:N-carbamoylputrescine amidase [Lachnospiraceae bacterium]